MIGNHAAAYQIRRWSAGGALAVGAIAVSAMVGVAAAHADPTPIDLLGEAQTDLTDATADLSHALSEVPSTSDIGAFATSAAMINDIALQQALDPLAASENTILSFDDGALSGLVSPLFTAFDEGWLQSSEAVLTADHGLETAVANGSMAGEVEAALAALGPELHVAGEAIITLFPVDELVGIPADILSLLP